MNAVLAVAAIPFALVLLIGAGMSSTRHEDVTSAAPPFPMELPPAPRPFPGTSTGCTVADPTGTGGCVTPATAWMLGQVETAFGSMPTSCWDAHAWNPRSDHPNGKGCDITFGEIGTFPSPTNTDHGWLVSYWLQSHADVLHVKYLIWQGLIWYSSRADQGWVAYSGGGVYDPSDPTGGHYDHVHISTTT